eukprot:scaffold133473_cov17-Tisochrysis_lutea.AAC.1
MGRTAGGCQSALNPGLVLLRRCGAGGEEDQGTSTSSTSSTSISSSMVPCCVMSGHHALCRPSEQVGYFLRPGPAPFYPIPATTSGRCVTFSAGSRLGAAVAGAVACAAAAVGA